MPGWRGGGEVRGASGAEGACEVCDTGVDAVGFLQERVYALDIVVVGGYWRGVVGFEVGVEGGCYVGHGFVVVCSFLEVCFSGPGYCEVM